MKLTTGQIKMMQEDMYAELIQMLMDGYGYTLEKQWKPYTILTPLPACKMQIQASITKVRVMYIHFSLAN